MKHRYVVIPHGKLLILHSSFTKKRSLRYPHGNRMTANWYLSEFESPRFSNIFKTFFRRCLQHSGVKTQQQWPAVVMWREEQSSMRFNIFTSISQVFNFQSIKSLLYPPLYYCCIIWNGGHVAKIIKRFNTEPFIGRKF